jgi:hypothetical protein
MKSPDRTARLRAYAAITILGLALLAGCNGHDSKPLMPGTLPASAVSATSPANATTGAGTTAIVTVSFSRAMNAASIDAGTFIVAAGAATVPGTVSFDAANNIASFAPRAALAANTVYTGTLTTGVQDATGNGLAAAYTWSFTTGAGADTGLPQVNATTPVTGASGVALNSRISATFTKAMDASSISSASFTVAAPGNVAVAGSVAFSGTTAIFTPTTNLAANTLYTATLTSAVKDLSGNPLAVAYTWTFTTGSTTDTTPPGVASSSIVNGASGVATNVKIGVFFSEPMDPTSINTTTFTLSSGTTSVVGTVSYTGGAAFFAPAAALTASSSYTATVTTAARDLAGNGLTSNFTLNFTTGAGAQLLVPAVLSTSPASGAGGIGTSQPITVTFNETMDPASITPSAFSVLASGITPITGTVAYGGTTASFIPTGGLAQNTVYTVTITGVRDLAGSTLATPYSFSFTTGITAAAAE